MATGRSDYPNQINNSCCFPGFSRGMLDVRAKRVNDQMKLAAAHALASIVAAIVSFIAVKWLLRYVQSHTFICFGIYRIVFAVMPASLFSRAAVLISETIAALDALYAPTPGPGSSAARLPIATRRPSPVWRRAGMVARKM